MYLQHRKNPASGFTLIEMLVVIAIIALLASLITPATTKALSSAKSAKCKSNLHQIGVVIMAYSTDHDGKLPSTGFYGISPYYNRDQRNFPNSLREYLGLEEASTWSTSPDLCSYAEIFHCPDYQGPVDGKGYLLTRNAETTFGTEVNPWGNIYSASGNLSSKPYSASDFPPDTVALRDFDYEEAVSHQNHRNALFFDLSVSSLGLDEE